MNRRNLLKAMLGAVLAPLVPKVVRGRFATGTIRLGKKVWIVIDYPSRDRWLSTGTTRSRA